MSDITNISKAVKPRVVENNIPNQHITPINIASKEASNIVNMSTTLEPEDETIRLKLSSIIEPVGDNVTNIGNTVIK